MSLNLSNFRTVFDDDFVNDSSLSKSLWAIQVDPSQYSFGSGGLTLTGYQTSPGVWSPVSFLQLDNAKTAGEGYGLYQFTGYSNPGQGAGICFELWRADDTYLDSTTPDKATEIDLLESFGGTPYSTVHYYEAGQPDDDGQTNTKLTGLNISQSHTYAVDWERGSLTFYIDGVEVYQNTTNAPLDAADGGSNEVMGAAILGENSYEPTSTLQLHITDMSYSAPVASAPVVTTPSNAVTLGGGVQVYNAAAGTSILAGGGADTITALAGGVTVTPDGGALTFFGGTTPSEVLAGIGHATIFGGAGGGNYSGGSYGNNVLISQGAAGANTTLTGGAAGDQLFGSAQGNDLLVAAVGRESVLGGGGNTTIIGGGTAASVIFTGSGATQVYGGDAGGDTIVGGSGNLAVHAQNGDAVFGDTGSLNVQGSTSGADSIIGGSGALGVTGEGGNMLVVTSTTESAIQVGNGASLIFASTGNNTVAGGTGWMEVLLGSGNTTVYEGGGVSIYEVVKGAAGGSDVINNFNASQDQVNLYGYQPSQIHTSVSGGNTFLSLSDGTSIEFKGVTNLGKSVN